MRIERFNQLAEADVQIEWIVEGLLTPGQWTYFVGPPASGKSMMCIQLCCALQEGKPFLGMKTRKHNCLYIQADAGRMEWREQVRKLAGESYAWTLHEIEKGFIDDPRWITYLHDIVWGTYPESDKPSSPHMVLKHIPYDFVVFDCLNAITQKDLNMKTSMSQVLSALEAICTQEVATGEEVGSVTRRAIHFVLIHHPSAGATRGVHAGSGYKGFSALCGNMLTLANNILVLEKNKITSKKEIELDRERDTGAWLLSSSIIVNGESKSSTALSSKDYEELLRG